MFHIPFSQISSDELSVTTLLLLGKQNRQLRHDSPHICHDGPVGVTWLLRFVISLGGYGIGKKSEFL